MISHSSKVFPTGNKINPFIIPKGEHNKQNCSKLGFEKNQNEMKTLVTNPSYSQNKSLNPKNSLLDEEVINIENQNNSFTFNPQINNIKNTDNLKEEPINKIDTQKENKFVKLEPHQYRFAELFSNKNK